MPKEKEYRVTWTIDVEACSKKEAAQKALAIQRDPDSIALVFRVEDKSETEVDLLEE